MAIWGGMGMKRKKSELPNLQWFYNYSHFLVCTACLSVGPRWQRVRETSPVELSP